MSWIRAVLTAALVAPIAFMSPKLILAGSSPATTSACESGLCDATIFGYSGPHTSDTEWDPAGAAADEAMQHCEQQCTPQRCAEANANGGYLGLCWAYTSADMHGASCPFIEDVWSTQPYGSDGPTLWWATASGTCPCAYPSGSEPLGVGRLEPTPTTSQQILQFLGLLPKPKPTPKRIGG